MISVSQIWTEEKKKCPIIVLQRADLKQQKTTNRKKKESSVIESTPDEADASPAITKRSHPPSWGHLRHPSRLFPPTREEKKEITSVWTW